MPSFDVVSEIDVNEVRNATENCTRELSTRFDFRGVEASFEYLDGQVKMTAEGEFQLKQMLDMLRSQCTKRKLDPLCMDTSGKIEITGKRHFRFVSFKQGIEQDVAKKMVKQIKDAKFKVQAAIQGDKLRVTGKKRDDLQQVMQMLRQAELGLPLQFNNFRD
mgnify:FL=1